MGVNEVVRPLHVVRHLWYFPCILIHIWDSKIRGWQARIGLVTQLLPEHVPLPRQVLLTSRYQR